MNLAAAQRAFIAEIAADDDHPSSNLGMAIYRNAYRARLVTALEVSFERTRTWVGEEAFAAAAAHHVLTSAPHSWTLDAYGADFPATLASLFAEDLEVSELAWLEWHMQQAFAAPDCGTLSPADLASAGLREADWDHLVFRPAAGFVQRPVFHELAGLWHGLAEGAQAPDSVIASANQHLIVWRHAMQPRFRLVEGAEWTALGGLIEVRSLGSVAIDIPAPDMLGPWLAQWLGEGLFSGFSLAD
jgi:hypothetical protein